jgi:hypothetical protein
LRLRAEVRCFPVGPKVIVSLGIHRCGGLGRGGMVTAVDIAYLVTVYLLSWKTNCRNTTSNAGLSVQ